jgi:hypothetical protein
VPVADPEPGDVDKMTEVFRANGRRPRLEFFLELWPNVPSLLEQKGFHLKDTRPALALRHEDWRGRRQTVSTRMATAEDAESINEIADIAFEGDGHDPNRVAAIRESIRAGRPKRRSFVKGEAVGCGRIVGAPDVRKVIAICTLPKFRRRGVLGGSK